MIARNGNLEAERAERRDGQAVIFDGRNHEYQEIHGKH